MHKVIVIYGVPDDPEHFRSHYEQVHIPLVESVPDLMSFGHTFDVTRFDDAAPIFCLFEGYFHSKATMLASMDSPQGLAASADVPNFATGTLEMFSFCVP